MRYALIGHGRMGREIDAHAAARDHQRVAVIGSGAALDAAALGDAEVAFEFTRPDVAAANVARLVDAGVTVVCGTTGWSPDAALAARLRAAPGGVVLAPNFSLGMQLFYRVAAEAARLFARVGGYDPFVLEVHHRGKRDAPSGTARRLAELCLEASPQLTEAGPVPEQGPLPPHVLPVTSVRAGGEPGTHVVGFDGVADRIQLEHRARGRAVFALGAVMAAEWMDGRTGLVTFEELVDDFVAGGGGQTP